MVGKLDGRLGFAFAKPALEMESHQAVRIWARTTSATRPSVNVQSIPRFLALHLTTLLKSVNKKTDIYLTTL